MSLPNRSHHTTPTSFWLAEALRQEPGPPCPPLEGARRADVCIVGGGYTGLWTAIELSERAPGLDIAVLEAGICGSGASGRNGGFATAWWDDLPELVEAFGPQQARFLAEASEDAVFEVGRFLEEEGIDAHYRRGGYLWAAASPAQVGVYNRATEACAALGRPDALQSVDGDECRQRIGCTLLLGGVFMPAGASVQPAILARALRQAALRRGVRIYEDSPVRRLPSTGPARVETPSGRVDAGVVVLAPGAWAARLEQLRRAILPVSSHIVVTEPIRHRIVRLGWTGGELFCDGRVLLHYAHVTRDGRIAFGGAGRTVGSAGHVPRRMLHDERIAADLVRDFRRFFPSLADVRFTHAWGGPVDRTPGRLHVPFFGRLGEQGRIVYGVGFSGNGVAPSRVAGRILASLALGSEDEWARCALVSGPRGLYPPEPFRALGAVLVRGALRRKETREDRRLAVDAPTRWLAGLASLALAPASRPAASPRRLRKRT